MTIAMTEFAPLATEIFVLVMACAILVTDVFLDDRRRWSATCCPRQRCSSLR